MSEIEGVTYAWSETGSEGIVWSVQDSRHISTQADGSREWSYEGLHTLKNGDHLTVVATDGTIAWEGVVDLEYKRNYLPYPENPQHGQQAVQGKWVRGLQRGVDPEVWLAMFRAEMPAKLTPKGS